MAITKTNRVKTTTATGSGSVFYYDFLIYKSTELQVLYQTSPSLAPVLQDSSTYTVSGFGTESGGSVTTNTPPASGTLVILQRVVPLTHVAQYPYGGDLPSGQLQTDFDESAMQIQQLDGDRILSLRFPVSDTGMDGTLPPAAARAGLVLAFDSNGNPIVVNVSGTGSFINIPISQLQTIGSQTVLGNPTGSSAVPQAIPYSTLATAFGALKASNNLGDLVSASTARANLGLNATSTVACLQVANDLSDLHSAIAARANLGLASTAVSVCLVATNNLSDVTNATTARQNLGCDAGTGLTQAGGSLSIDTTWLKSFLALPFCGFAAFPVHAANGSNPATFNNLSISGGYVLGFNQEVFDTHNAFDANGTFTVPTGQGGTYYFRWFVTVTNSGTYTYLDLYKNGSLAIQGSRSGFGEDTNGTVVLAAGDVIKIHVYNDTAIGGGTYGQSFFVGYRVS